MDLASAFQQAQTVEDNQQARAHVGEDGHPHGGAAEDCEDEEHGLDAKREDDVLPEDGVRPFRKPDGLGHLRRSSFMMSTSAASFAVSVPAPPMEKPTDAAARLGESLTPSPTMPVCWV